MTSRTAQFGSEVVTALITGFVLVAIMVFTHNQVMFLLEHRETTKLENAPVTDFLDFNGVIPTKDYYSIGVPPSFYFNSAYKKFGTLTGFNTLICADFRSDVFIGQADVTEETQSESFTLPPRPFTFGGNLPATSTTCILQSDVRLCESKYGICKTRQVISQPFEYR